MTLILQYAECVKQCIVTLQQIRFAHARNRKPEEHHNNSVYNILSRTGQSCVPIKMHISIRIRYLQPLTFARTSRTGDLNLAMGIESKIPVSDHLKTEATQTWRLLDTMLSQFNPSPILRTYFLKIHITVIIPDLSRSPKWMFSVMQSLSQHPIYIPRPSQPHRYHQANNAM